MARGVWMAPQFEAAPEKIREAGCRRGRLPQVLPIWRSLNKCVPEGQDLPCGREAINVLVIHRARYELTGPSLGIGYPSGLAMLSVLRTGLPT